MNEQTVPYLIERVRRNFRSFGGGDATPNNPLAHAIKDHKPQFAAGVDIEDVVLFILNELRGAENRGKE